MQSNGAKAPWLISSDVPQNYLGDAFMLSKTRVVHVQPNSLGNVLDCSDQIHDIALRDTVLHRHRLKPSYLGFQFLDLRPKLIALAFNGIAKTFGNIIGKMLVLLLQTVGSQQFIKIGIMLIS